jgi:hypothetical protein
MMVLKNGDWGDGELEEISFGSVFRESEKEKRATE